MSLGPGAPGMTINFDGAQLSDKIENEMRQEEEMNQREIRDLLQAALHDSDLLDDDDEEDETNQENSDDENPELQTTDDLNAKPLV